MVYDRRLVQFIRAAVADEWLEEDSALHTIAWKVAREGYGELPRNQQIVFRTRVIPILQRVEPDIDITDFDD